MKILLFDTETTGLFDYNLRADAEGQPRMIQLSAHLFEPGSDKPSGGFTFAVKPDGWKMPEDLARKLGHGMTTEWLEKNGQFVEFVLDLYRAMYAQADLIAGYGVSFDLKVMRGELRRAGMPDLYKTKPDFCIMNEITSHCKMPPTAKMRSAGMGGFKTPKLAEAVKIILGEDLGGAHSADVDAMAAIKLFNWLGRNKTKAASV